ncbi:hypothetical protein G5V59_08505 [Nocardioides sp. W3-2-3]|uniref:hypothetical protein n=1 Tax=Nocardioides convexus TaxID=2712224 RepID=UPI0024181F21|nr:hypothetical protein [Nocardioides convexus]NHA00165.1 hypothetical protein [Nocardioides convexus]
MELHDALRDVVTRHGESMLADSMGFRGVLDDVLEEDQASTGDINLLTDAVRFDVLTPLKAMIDSGADAGRAVEEAGARLARDRGGDPLSSSLGGRRSWVRRGPGPRRDRAPLPLAAPAVVPAAAGRRSAPARRQPAAPAGDEPPAGRGTTPPLRQRDAEPDHATAQAPERTGRGRRGGRRGRGGRWRRDRHRARERRRRSHAEVPRVERLHGGRRQPRRPRPPVRRARLLDQQGRHRVQGRRAHQRPERGRGLHGQRRHPAAGDLRRRGRREGSPHRAPGLPRRHADRGHRHDRPLRVRPRAGRHLRPGGRLLGQHERPAVGDAHRRRHRGDRLADRGSTRRPRRGSPSRPRRPTRCCASSSTSTWSLSGCTRQRTFFAGETEESKCEAGESGIVVNVGRYQDRKGMLDDRAYYKSQFDKAGKRKGKGTWRFGTGKAEGAYYAYLDSSGKTATLYWDWDKADCNCYGVAWSLPGRPGEAREVVARRGRLTCQVSRAPARCRRGRVARSRPRRSAPAAPSWCRRRRPSRARRASRAAWSRTQAQPVGAAEAQQSAHRSRATTRTHRPEASRSRRW